MNVVYCGPLKDYSGYGEANRHFVAALDTAGVRVIPELVSYSIEASDFGTLGQRLEPIFANTGKAKIKILHTTPNVFKKHIDKDKYNIAHFFWETDRVPEEFVDGLKLCDEIWTGSEANKAALLKSGVDLPIYIFPQPIETDRVPVKPFKIPNFEGFLFYSIFEWTDRKNPKGLLQAYWEEFQDNENVGLLIKTYFSGFTTSVKRTIRHQIERYKQQSGLTKFPPVFLYMDLMDRPEIDRLHETGDCYVSAHRGEGWGIPQVEAVIHKNPVLSTGYGGCHEYFENGKEMRLLPYKLVQLRGMSHSDRWYTKEQNWAEPNLKALRAGMRFAYDQPDRAAEMASRAHTKAMDIFSFEAVGEAMANRLKQIKEKL